MCGRRRTPRPSIAGMGPGARACRCLTTRTVSRSGPDHRPALRSPASASPAIRRRPPPGRRSGLPNDRRACAASLLLKSLKADQSMRRTVSCRRDAASSRWWGLPMPANRRLLNALVGSKVAIVSPKDPDHPHPGAGHHHAKAAASLVFVDTPGNLQTQAPAGTGHGGGRLAGCPRCRSGSAAGRLQRTRKVRQEVWEIVAGLKSAGRPAHDAGAEQDRCGGPVTGCWRLSQDLNERGRLLHHLHDLRA